jgi:HlyD family secretion protein
MEQKLIGFIAYGLYHDAKREWISDFQTREGRYPHDEELREYERSWTASRLEGLKNAAVQSIAAYTDSVLAQAETQILRNALKGGVWRAVWCWLVSAMLYTLIVIGVIVIMARSGIDFVGLLERVITPRWGNQFPLNKLTCRCCCCTTGAPNRVAARRVSPGAWSRPKNESGPYGIRIALSSSKIWVLILVYFLAEDQLKRIDIRAPQDGRVHQLAVHTVGGVISAGEAIMLVVPGGDVLTVEARIAPHDIDQIRVGQHAVLRFSTFNQRTTPEINGEVGRISADITQIRRPEW